MSKKEFGKILPLLGVEAPPEAISALFDSFDPDGSGTIEYQELSQILTRGGRKARNYTPGMVLLPVTKQRVHVARPGERLGQDKSFFRSARWMSSRRARSARTSGPRGLVRSRGR